MRETIEGGDVRGMKFAVREASYIYLGRRKTYVAISMVAVRLTHADDDWQSRTGGWRESGRERERDRSN